MTTKKIQLPTIEKLADAGVHYGHRTRRWHPKMEQFIYGTRENIHIIDLEKTLARLNEAATFIAEKSHPEASVLLVGTKRQAAETVKKMATDNNIFHITERWPGGLITNFKSIEKTISKFADLTEKVKDEEYLNTLTTKKKYQLIKEQARLEKLVGGLTGITKVPDIVIIIDPKREQTAINETRIGNIPTIGIIDTNTDPSLVDYPIPANDDALRSIELILSTLVSSLNK